MKLLFDENLSPRLVHLVAELFPGSTHVSNVGLASADDESVWSHASEHDFVIVSKDSDFHQRSFVKGAPPKVIWLRCGNCGTQEISEILQKYQTDCELFANDPETAFLEIS